MLMHYGRWKKIGVAFLVLSACVRGPMPGPQTGLEKRAVETQVYEGSYDEVWNGTLTLFQDLNILPTFTDKQTGIIKAEVPYTDYKVMKKAMATLLVGIFAVPYWISTDNANMTFTAWVRPLDESHVSVRLLGISSKGDQLWGEGDYPILHNKLREIIQQQKFLQGTQTPLE